MQFYLSINPPTATAQEKKVSVVHGRPVFYNPPAVRKAKELLCKELVRFKPDEPFDGAVLLLPLFPDWLLTGGSLLGAV